MALAIVLSGHLWRAGGRALSSNRVAPSQGSADVDSLGAGGGAPVRRALVLRVIAVLALTSAVGLAYLTWRAYHLLLPPGADQASVEHRDTDR